MPLGTFRQRLIFLFPHGGDELAAAVRDFCRHALALGHPAEAVRSLVARQPHAGQWSDAVRAEALAACDEVLGGARGAPRA